MIPVWFYSSMSGAKTLFPRLRDCKLNNKQDKFKFTLFIYNYAGISAATKATAVFVSLPNTESDR